MANILMTADEFVLRLRKAMDSEQNTYCNSCFGSNLTFPDMLDQYTTETSWDRKHAAETTAKAKAAAAAGKPLYGWDCVNFTPKGILWGWNGDLDDPRAGAVYKSNGVPDTTIDAIYNKYCTEQSTDWSKVAVGEFVVYSESYGHCGVYIGDGMVIECTTKWDSKIQITQVQNMIDNGMYPVKSDKRRTWWAHGKLVWIDYSIPNVDETIVRAVCPCCGSVIDLTIALSPAYRKYYVRSGDNVCKIAREQLGDESQYRLILQINRLPENAILHTGDLLYLPNYVL